MSKEVKEFIDQCWKMLNRHYEEAYGTRNFGYGKPQFRFILSHDELMMLRLHTAKLAITNVLTINGNGQETLFGHEVQEQRRTPFLEVLIAVKTIDK